MSAGCVAAGTALPTTVRTGSIFDDILGGQVGQVARTQAVGMGRSADARHGAPERGHLRLTLRRIHRPLRPARAGVVAFNRVGQHTYRISQPVFGAREVTEKATVASVESISRIFTSNHLWLSPCRSRALSMKMATRLPAATRPKTENAGSCCSSRVRSMFVRKPCKCSNKVKISLDWRVCVRADRVTLM